jgi:hypothetical protein
MSILLRSGSAAAPGPAGPRLPSPFFAVPFSINGTA